MPKEASSGAPCLAGEDLRALKQRLVRQRVLHIALNQVERGILHLCCRLNLQARSSALRLALESICRKASLWLSLPLRSKAHLLRRLLAAGRRIAEANVKAAGLMGHPLAASWEQDVNYVLLLGLTVAEGGS
jgi:hypothetical protein